MKNLFKTRLIWFVVSAMLLVYACDESFLDVPVSGGGNPALLSGEAGINAALIGAYSQVNGRNNAQMGSPLNWVWGSIRGGDATKGTDPGDFGDLNSIQIYEVQTTNNQLLVRYRANYEGVARTNNVLRLLRGAAPEVTAASKTAIEAQTKFLRAHFYFQLKIVFNNTPYVDENIDEKENEAIDVEAGIGDVKNDKDLWPMIEADMLFAYENLPETQKEVGRVNKWAAASYLAKIYMYQKKFAQAKALYDVIIPTGKTSNDKKYELVPKYNDVFRASNDNNSESIWAYQAAANTGNVNNANPEMVLNWPYNTGPEGPGNCCSFFQPSFEMANSYRTSAGLPLLDGSYNVGANQLITDMGKESKDPYTVDDGPLDPRIDHSMGRRGIPYLDWKVMPGKDWIRNQPNAGPFSPKKYAYYKTDAGSLQDNSSWTPGYTAINFTVIRFADVLLMAAEAEIEVGSLIKAQEYVNLVRARAMNPEGRVMGKVTGYEPTVPPADPGPDFKKPIVDYSQPAANYSIGLYTVPWPDQTVARNAVRFERKLELMGEGHRFFDLVRWGIAKPAIDAYLAYEVPKYPSGALNGASFELNKDEYLPLPQAQIDLKPGVLIQNPGFN